MTFDNCSSVSCDLNNAISILYETNGETMYETMVSNKAGKKVWSQLWNWNTTCHRSVLAIVHRSAVNWIMPSLPWAMPPSQICGFCVRLRTSSFTENKDIARAAPRKGTSIRKLTPRHFANFLRTTATFSDVALPSQNCGFSVRRRATSSTEDNDIVYLNFRLRHPVTPAFISTYFSLRLLSL